MLVLCWTLTDGKANLELRRSRFQQQQHGLGVTAKVKPAEHLVLLSGYSSAPCPERLPSPCVLLPPPVCPPTLTQLQGCVALSYCLGFYILAGDYGSSPVNPTELCIPHQGQGQKEEKTEGYK